MNMRETKDLEYKEAISNTFLKTVSAFANYGTGSIKFGIKDDGTIIGIKNPKQACLDIENRINDSIDPVPDYSLSIHEKSGVITLRVEEGMHKPYLYKAKAYKRNDSATIEVDRLELTRLVLEGENLSYVTFPDFNYSEEEQEEAAEVMFDNLVASPTHYDNMVFGSFTKVGIRTNVANTADGTRLTTAYLFSN